MKQFLLMLTLLSAAVCFADDKAESPKKSDTEVTLNVSGMDCSSCAKSVVTIYSKLKGVAEVKADEDKGTVQIKYDSKTICEADLLEALKEKPKYKVSKPEKK